LLPLKFVISKRGIGKADRGVVRFDGAPCRPVILSGGGTWCRRPEIHAAASKFAADRDWLIGVTDAS